MGKQFFILNSPSGNAGVAKIIKTDKKSVLSVYINKTITGKKKCYIHNSNEKFFVGTTYKNKFSFELNPEMKINGVYLTTGSPEKIIMWSGENKPDFENINLGADNDHSLVSDEQITFDNFFEGGFQWHRIRGNFIMFDYSIVHHILSQKYIYPAINRAGYYCAGIKNLDDLTLIAIAIPEVKGIENPFTGINADTYKIYKANKVFNALCVGIDKTGEFFLSK